IVEAVNNDESFADLAHSRVSYRSSDPTVARVSDTGQVTALAPGAATISVTVNGATGAPPILVNQPFTVSAPAVAEPGTTFTVTTTLPNGYGASALSDVTLSLDAPGGWAVKATSPTTFASVASGATATTTWQVSV